MRPWHFGNTTVRSPFRLREGLVALSTSPLQGNLRGEEQEKAFRNLLGDHGIVTLGTDSTYSVGRKWRSALNKLGFLYPEVPRNNSFSQDEIGPVDMITPNGWRLIRAESVPAIQECFLRALAAHFIPSVLEQQYDFTTFSPLKHTLNIMLEIEKQIGESGLNFIEIAVIVQNTNSTNEMSDIARTILQLRNKRLESKNKRQFDRIEREKAGEKYGYSPGTYNDYADTNIRYLKATGLVQNKGRGIAIVPEKHLIIEQIVQDKSLPHSDIDYFRSLCEGATLPTDDKESALLVVKDLEKQLSSKGISVDVSNYKHDTPADISVIRHNLENVLSEYKEVEYAKEQANEWEEIVSYMELLKDRKNRKIFSNGMLIEIPQSEAPAYFEWVLWRAFLAINSLENKPYEARRFKIDQDFLPVGTAPGNGPDLIFEFSKFVIVVEVTLTDNSRQEAAEGEPVRRHVADLVEKYKSCNKDVIGLFIANRIDSNTAETFRIGVWYDREDNKMELEIIPLTLHQFMEYFRSCFISTKVSIDALFGLLIKCGLNKQKLPAPEWKNEISNICLNEINMMCRVI